MPEGSARGASDATPRWRLSRKAAKLPLSWISSRRRTSASPARGSAASDEHLLARYVEPGKIAGALTLVARRGKIAFLSPVGKMDRERAMPMRTDTLFRIYSMTKPVTSVALMMLHERGAFELSDPVHKWLPGWDQLRVYRYGQYPNFVTVQADRPMSVRDLLTNMSGTFATLSAERTPPRWRVPQARDRRQQGHPGRHGGEARAAPLLFSPGTHWSYSVATDVIARLVEILSGRQRRPVPSPGDLRAARHSRHRLHGRRREAAAPGTPPTTRAPSRGRRWSSSTTPLTSAYARPKTLFTGSSGLISTAADYVRFAEMLRRGGEIDGVRILGPRTVRYMTRNLPGGVDLASISTESTFSETPVQGRGVRARLPRLARPRAHPGPEAPWASTGGAA